MEVFGKTDATATKYKILMTATSYNGEEIEGAQKEFFVDLVEKTFSEKVTESISSAASVVAASSSVATTATSAVRAP